MFKKETNLGPAFMKFTKEYIEPGTRLLAREMIEQRLEPLRKDLGWKKCHPTECTHLHRPEISVSEKIDAIAEFLGVSFVVKPGKPEIPAQPSRVIAVVTTKCPAEKETP